MSKFWLRVLELNPKLAGKFVYFCPSTTNSLRCVICRDGTIAPTCSLSTEFNSAVRLADVLKSGRIKLPTNFRMPKISSNLFSFSQDFFFQPGRKDRLRESFSQNVSKELASIENAQERGRELAPIDGIILDEPLPVELPAATASQPQPGAESGPYGVSNEAPPPQPEKESEPDDFDLSEFWTVVLEVKPELVGKTVYFAPTKTKNVPCVVNSDRTFSPICDATKRYYDAAQLAADIIWGRIDLGQNAFTLHKGPAMYTCVDDFFLDPYRNENLLASLGKFTRCAGSQLAKYESLIKDRCWDSTRSAISPVVINGDKVRSKKCTTVAIGAKTRCDACSKSEHVLRHLAAGLQKRSTNLTVEQRLIFTGNHLLTPEDRKRRNELLQKEHKIRINTARRHMDSLKKQLRRTEKELEKYKPMEVNDQVAVRSVVEYLNEEAIKTKSPTCYWLEQDQLCGFSTDSVVNMCAHVNSVHYRSQVEANRDLNEEHQQFRCYWRGCSRRAFLRAHQLHLHLFDHTGSRASVQRLSALRCQLSNLARGPTARRFNDDALMAAANQFDTRGMYEKKRASSILPMPSVNTIEKIKVHAQEWNTRRALVSERLDSVFDAVLNRTSNGDDGNGPRENGVGHSDDGPSNGGQADAVNNSDAVEDDDQIHSNVTVEEVVPAVADDLGAYANGGGSSVGGCGQGTSRVREEDIFEEDPEDDDEFEMEED